VPQVEVLWHWSLELLGRGEGVADLDIGGHESIAIVENPVKHLKKQKNKKTCQANIFWH
jgi:hypothetical protein